MSIALRPATPDDADAVTEVMCRSRQAFMRFAPMVHTPEEVRGWIGEVLIPTGGVHVATDEGVVVALIAIAQTDDAGWIHQLFVAPGRTGEGIGTLLLELARSRLPTPIRLYTFQANTGARRFYERHGFVAVAFGDGADNEERCPDVLYQWPAAPPG